MERIIKFRAWDSVSKRMIGWTDTVFPQTGDPKIDNSIYLCGYPLKNAAKSYLKYMQFTGLLDKNGKEIYEGDIIEDDEGRAAVEFRLGKFVCWADDLSDLDMSANKVIGNIYEPNS